ncbi:MAG: efflux RND transporter permease subunit [Gammaproteobacteria bacterium]
MERLRAALNRGLDGFIARSYQPLLQRVITLRYPTVAVFVALLLITGALVAGGYVRQSLEPDVTLDTFSAQLSLPPGTPFSETRERAKQIERAFFAVRAERDRAQPAGSPSVIINLETMIREQSAGFWLEVAPHARQHLDVKEFIRDWRAHIGDLGRAKVDFHYREGDVGYDLELTLNAPQPHLLEAATDLLKQRLAGYPGVYDVIDSRVMGKPELRLQLKPQAEQLGLALEDLASQVRGAYFGEEAQRFIRGREEVKVMVRLPLAERRSLEHLRSFPVRLPAGAQAPLGSLAEVSFAPGYAQITRQDRRRVLKVQARIDPLRADPNALYADLQQGYLRSLEQRFPGLRVTIGEQRQEQVATLEALARNGLIALAVIYALIAIPFRSYLQPLVFMMSVPVAWMGAVLSHWLVGLPLSMESLVGMIAASGVVVNDSLVLLHYVHRRRNAGRPLRELIDNACTARFRPIFLTFLTNFAGFLPMLFETSMQAQFLVPMVLALASGLLFGMMATLVLTPACFVLLEDVRRLFRRSENQQRVPAGEDLALSNEMENENSDASYAGSKLSLQRPVSDPF